MALDKSILIIDDTKVNREILKKILQDKYEVFEAVDGKDGLDKFIEHKDELSAVILDLVMPNMDGYGFLEELQKNDGYGDVPVLVATGDSNEQAEDKCLALGAADFIQKPYRKNTLELRLHNAISRRHIEYLEKIKYLSERDNLTGIYNKSFFAKEVMAMLEQEKEQRFALIRLDVDQFRLFNSFFGTETGNELLKHIGKVLHDECEQIKNCLYGRAESDVFLSLMPYENDEEIITVIKQWEKEIDAFNREYCLEISMGIYRIKDRSFDFEKMYAFASTAARQCKNKYMYSYAFYDASMNEHSYKEQLLLNDMQYALDENQFLPYIQPKFNLEKEVPFGGEALIRWKHPSKGLISPAEFIPVSEKNGFIVKLDYFMWESICKLIRKWIDEGKTPDPISVNMSRISLYNPHVTDLLVELVKKYDIPPSLLNLEVTESAYMDNPDLMKNTVNELQKNGFIIMMDDFGSGYSSLNTLKDIDVDILKIDMKFLPTGEDNDKSEKILVSVIRMAGWLGLPVVVEGVETAEQKVFLKDIGCEYVQGYYYNRPMPVDEYETLVNSYKSGNQAEESMPTDIQNIWEYNPHIENLLKSISIPVGMYEVKIDSYQLLRTNEAFEKEFKFGEMDSFGGTAEVHRLTQNSHNVLTNALYSTSMDQTARECEIEILNSDGEGSKWYRVKSQFINTSANRNMVCAVFSEITLEKRLEEEIGRVKNAFASHTKKISILAVDDNDIIRSVVKSIFDDGYNIIEATNGKSALDYLSNHSEEIDIILLDLIMPIMGGEEFLSIKNRDPKIADIPVVVISVDDDTTLQTKMLQNGVNDYVTKPFVPDVMERRVKNVIEYNSRFRNLVKEYEKSLVENKK